MRYVILSNSEESDVICHPEPFASLKGRLS